MSLGAGLPRRNPRNRIVATAAPMAPKISQRDMSLDKALGERGRLPDYLGDPRLADKPQTYLIASLPLLKSMASIWVTRAIIARELAPMPSAGPGHELAKCTFAAAGYR